jgi:excisionase family DNA binding protein
MTASWDDEYLTVSEIAEHLRLNQQTVRNWIDQGSLPAVRIGRRVRVRRVDLDRILAQGTTAPDPVPPTTPAAPLTAHEELAEALQRAQRLLGRRSAARRAELAEGLQELTGAVAAALQTLSHDSGAPKIDDAANQADPDTHQDVA